MAWVGFASILSTSMCVRQQKVYLSDKVENLSTIRERFDKALCKASSKELREFIRRETKPDPSTPKVHFI